MALEGLEPVLTMLYERSRFTLTVHPDDAAEARRQVRHSYMLGLVRVVENKYMPRGDFLLMAADQIWSFRSLPDATTTATETPIGA